MAPCGRQFDTLDLQSFGQGVGDHDRPFFARLPTTVGEEDFIAVDAFSGVHSDAFGARELAVARSGGAELGEVFAIFVELLDSVVVGVGDPEVAFGVDRYTSRLVELSVAGTA